ncbi:MAG: YqgE/AlgH family protein [Deltaproteobacteria bacterium]|nr:YqgE/AlgH family protein [Deltaproteobacteria bacterium]
MKNVSSLKSSFLIAMPSLQESLFSHSVILMAEKKDSGAMGFIINLPTGTMLMDALKILKIKNQQPLSVPILFGGPVQTDFFWFIHSTDFIGNSTLKVSEVFSLSSAMDILPVLDDPICPEIYQAGVGYAGWGPNQLEHEIELGSWWLDDFSLDMLFNVPHKEKWEFAFESLGADPTQLVDPTDPDSPSIN